VTDAGERATLPSLFRADSVRNSALNLEAIPEPVRIHAPDVGMDQIARAAGVAVGTLCLHFPTKSDFVGAVESEVVDAVADDAEALLARVLAGETLGREITEFLCRVLEAGASNLAAKTTSRELGASGENRKDETRVSVGVNGTIDTGRSTCDRISQFLT